MTDKKDSDESKPKQPLYWLIYISALLSGVILLAQALEYAPGMKISARLGIALVYSAFAFLVAGRRPSAYLATALVWVAVIVTFVV